MQHCLSPSNSNALNRPGYFVKVLTPENSAAMQCLYGHCTDFSLLNNGCPFSPTEVCDEFAMHYRLNASPELVCSVGLDRTDEGVETYRKT
jgi:hypothetical protein